jgi:hypothetical protein
LLLSLYGDQRADNVNLLLAQRKKLLTELANADVTLPLTVDVFLHSSMSYEAAQKVRREYMSFIKEVTAVEAGNSHPNAAKTLYNIIVRNLASKAAAMKETVSYFGHVSESQFDTIWSIVGELQVYAASKESSSKATAEFGLDLAFAPPALSYPREIRNHISVLDKLCSVISPRKGPTAPAAAAPSSSAKKAAVAAPAAAARLSAEQETRAASRTWLRGLCEAHVRTNPNGPFDAPQLADGIIKACDQAALSADGEGALQMALFDLIGEEGFELMLEVIQQRARIAGLGDISRVEAPAASAAPASAAAQQPQRDGRWAGVSAEDRALIESLSAEAGALSVDGGEDFNDPYPELGYVDDANLSANQRRKREQKASKALERVMAESAEQAPQQSGDWLAQLGFDDEYLLEERALGLQKGRSLAANPDNWLSNLAAEGSTQVHEKRGLPAGTERFVRADHEEVDIPAASRPPAPAEGKLLYVYPSLFVRVSG